MINDNVNVSVNDNDNAFSVPKQQYSSRNNTSLRLQGNNAV